MSDREIRDLARQAATGDIEAEIKILLEECRIDDHDWAYPTPYYGKPGGPYFVTQLRNGYEGYIQFRGCCRCGFAETFMSGSLIERLREGKE